MISQKEAIVWMFGAMPTDILLSFYAQARPAMHTAGLVELFVVSLIAVIVLGPVAILVTYLLLKHRATKRELQALRDDVAQMKAGIDDLREQVADFIIKTN